MYSLLLIGIFSVQIGLAKVGFATCTNKEDCSEGYTCHEKTCRKCLKCDLLFRKGNFCVVDFSDCGECLENYEEILLTDHSNTKKPCQPIKKKSRVKGCKNDSGCPQNNYCNEESCIECFDCGLFNRVPRVGECAKGLYECGSCINGYYELSVTTEVNYKPCEKDTLLVSGVPDDFMMTLGSIAPVFSVLVLLFIMVLLHKKIKDRASSKSFSFIYHRPVSPSAPPLHSLNSPQYVRKADEFHPITLNYVKGETQQAKVFRKPTAPYYNDPYESDTPSPENNDDSSPPSDESIELGQINCFPRILLREASQNGLNELGVDSHDEQLPENMPEENVPYVDNAIAVDVVDVSDMNADSHDEETNYGPESQNAEENQNSANSGIAFCYRNEKA